MAGSGPASRTQSRREELLNRNGRLPRSFVMPEKRPRLLRFGKIADKRRASGMNHSPTRIQKSAFVGQSHYREIWCSSLCGRQNGSRNYPLNVKEPSSNASRFNVMYGRSFSRKCAAIVIFFPYFVYRHVSSYLDASLQRWHNFKSAITNTYSK